MRQAQVPQRPVEMLLVLRACVQRAVVRMLPISTSSCAGLCHGGEVAEVVGQESDGIVRPGLDHLQDRPPDQLSHPSLRQKLPVAVRFGGFSLGHTWRRNTGPALLLVRHCC